MVIKDGDLFKLQDKQNILYNKKLAKKSNFKEIVYKILDKKYNNLRDRCKVQDYSVPRVETIENNFNDFIKDTEFKCYYCEMTMLYFSDEYRKNKTLSEETDAHYPHLFSIEHKKPLSKGGNNTKNNITFCCISCNIIKDSMLEEDFKEIITNLTYDNKMKLFDGRIDLNRFISNRIKESRTLRKENNKLDNSNAKEKIKLGNEIINRENTISQLQSNMTIIKKENGMLHNKLNEKDECIDETIDSLKDSYISQLREENKLLRNVNSSTMRLKYIEVKMQQMKK